MITVEVDCNSDVIRLIENGHTIAEYGEIAQPNKMIEIFEEIFNRITFDKDKDCFNLELTKVDEDRRKQIGEW